MKLRTSFLTRFLALALALVMIVSSANLGLVARVFAASDSEITDGELVAKNYDLSAAEKALLESGLLKEQTHQYQVPADDDGLVVVDPEGKGIVASSFKSWKPVSAKLTASDGTEEVITLVDGENGFEGTFEYDGNAYTVFVTYEATIDVDTTVQTTLLSAAGWLKQGVANTDAVSGQQGNLYILEQSMPELVKFADNGVNATLPGGQTQNFYLDEELKVAIYELNNQMKANGGKLNLSVMVGEYDASSKTQYLMTKGADMKAEVAALVKNAHLITTMLNGLVSNLTLFVQNGWVSQETANQLTTLAGVTNKLETGLTTVNNDPWTILEKDVLADNVDYAKLDTLVAALGATSDVTVNETLKLGTTTVKVSTSMADVKITIELSHYVNGTLTDAETFEQTVTLAQGATKADVETEVNNLEQVAIQAYQTAGIDLNHFETKIECSVNDWTNGLPEGEHTYTVTYVPKNYEVTYVYDGNKKVTKAYGEQITLDVHSNSSLAYDYYVNGDYYAQGSKITVTEDVTIDREEGASYVEGDLLTIIANNYTSGNEVASAILKSKALKDNKAINVRYPDGKSASIADDVLSVPAFPASYNGLSWVPYSYKLDGTGDEILFNGATKVDLSGKSYKNVQVTYQLTLDVSEETVSEKLNLVNTLVAEAQAQKAALDRINAQYSNLEQLNGGKLAALSSLAANTDFDGDGTVLDDPEDKPLQDFFVDVIARIQKDCLTGGNSLTVKIMMDSYRVDGLAYYYRNHLAVQNEIGKLSGYLDEMLATQERKDAIATLLELNGMGELKTKIEDLKTIMNEVYGALTAPNAAIDVNSDNLKNLTDALAAEGYQEVNTAGGLLTLKSGEITVARPGSVAVTVKVMAGEITGIVSETFDLDKETGKYSLTQADVDGLKAALNNKIAELGLNAGDYAKYYTSTYNNDLGDLTVGTELTRDKTVTFTWSLKDYTVKVEGMDSQTINLEHMTINLAPSADEAYRYDYVIGGTTVNTSVTTTYTFTKEQIDTLFVNGSYTVSLTKVNLGSEKLTGMVNALNGAMGKNAVTLNDAQTELTVTLAPSDLMGFAMGLLDTGYGYIGLGNDTLIGKDENLSLEFSIQALINAILNDNTFSTDTIINLRDGEGKLLESTMKVGDSAEGAKELKFVMNLEQAPSAIATVANALEQIKPYVYFKSNNGELEVDLNLPEKVYQVYLTALIATGNVDLSDTNAVSEWIAFEFVHDYVDTVLNFEGVTVDTYINTLAKFGVDMGLTDEQIETYNGYYSKLYSMFENKELDISVKENGTMGMAVSVNGNKTISALVGKLTANMEPDKKAQITNFLAAIKEYKDTSATIDVNAFATLKNVANEYEALILDNGKSGVTNKFDYVKKDELAGTTISGAAVVILLKDTTADLTFPATAILDLNGFALTGNVKSNGNLIIIDSDMDTFNGGSVNGDVSGNVTVIGGTYTDDVTAYLKDGYVQENGTVSNALYTIEADDAGNVTYKLNSDIYRDVADGEIPSVKALAIDIAGDLLMNYFTTACLELEGQKIYGVALDDLLAILEGKGADGKIDALIEDVLNSVSAPGISNFVNAIIADVLDFENISKNIGKDPIATYKMVTAPWHVDINHVQDGDYLTVGIGYGDKSNDYTVSLEIVGDNRAINEVRELTTALAEIVTTTDVTVNIEQPTYNADSNTFDVTGTAKAVVEIDLTKNDNYTTVLAVILANGTGKTSYVEALNAGDMDALKAAVDATTITEVFTALKALSRDVNFAAMAKKVGAEVTADAAALEAVYHIYLTAAGAVLDRFDVTGGNRTLGSFDSDDDGIYVADKEDIVRTGDAAAKGYTVNYNLSLSELSLTVKVFGETTEEPEKPAPIVVTDTEGNKVYEGESFLDAIAAVKEGYTVTINENVAADGGANVICSFNVVGADKLDMGTNFLTISNLDHKITSDADNLNVAANIDGYKAAYVDGAYQLVEFNVIVMHPAVADYWFVKETDAESETRYIFLDTPPRMGMTLTHLDDNMLVDFNAESLVAEIAGNDGDALVKTGDIMKVTAKVGQKTVAYITYTVIVVGDANCDGLVQSGDATKMMTIYTDDDNGVEGVHSYVERLAADTWFNGQIQSGDATRIFTKYTTVMAYGDSAENQELGWNDWCEFVASEKN